VNFSLLPTQRTTKKHTEENTGKRKGKDEDDIYRNGGEGSRSCGEEGL